MSKTKQQTPRSTVGSPKATPRGDLDPSQPVQLSVLVLQADALEHDEAVRQELKRSGFVVKQQALVNLSVDAARQFVLEVCNPHSALYRPPAPVDTEAEGHSASNEGHAADAGAHIPIVTDAHSSSDTADDNEIMEHAIHALASGPTLVLGVERPNAVAELLQLVGPANPAAWTESSNACLRARFAKDAPRRLGLRCSAQELTASHELAFLMAHSGNKVHAHAHPQGQAAVMPLPSGETSSAKTAAMGLDQLLNFLFPEHLQHPNSAGRLFVFGLYGPLDAHSRLRSGEKGLHVVTDRELTTMSARMEREDILAVYGMCSLSQEEEEEVVRQVDHLLKRFPQYTPRDIEALLAPLPRNSDGNMSFHDMQRAVLKERLRRVVCMKERLHPALAEPVRNQFARTLTRVSAKKDGGLVNGAPSSFFLKDVGATNVENATLVSRLLSTRAFQICQMEDGNSPELTQNVRLLRPDKAQKGPEREPWNPNCQKRSQPGRQ
ncbi:putative aspartyl protease family A01A [Phytophthora cinnamomi]|uniref:putative aspartyl protease family A01A n=1 Tax=Phytophthora cinnamomi TaxID=4785 RepID=UPI00355AB209|nr:putative aspartyl protease family A01A [Phytophthora cinnamomi]